MKNIFKMGLLGAVALSMSIFSTETIASQKQYVMRFAHVVRPTTAKGMGAEKFAQLLEERTNGRIKVEVYPDSQLGTDQEITEQMQMGTVQMNAPFTGVLPSFVPQFQVFDLPFLFDDEEMVQRAVTGEFGKKMDSYLSRAGLKSLGFWDGGFKHLTNSVKPINAPEDMKGLKIRASQSPLLILQFRTLEAGGISIPFAELYTALQNKTVDGQENPLSNIVSRKFYEVQNHMTLSGHGYLGYPLLISEDFYNKLPKDLQAIVDEVAKEVTEWQWKESLATESKYLEELRNTKMEITELTPENKEKFRVATANVYKEFEKISGGKELLELVEKARKK